jgi:serine protease DegS
VVQQANRVTVTLQDGSTYEATPVGFEPNKDLAVLKIDAPEDKLVPVRLGDSSLLEVGRKVIAIGNPFGLDTTMTVGVVSALGREIDSITRRKIRDVIQTDAAINPGNSGGALINADGALVGINTAIFSRSGGSQGVGFAIPTRLAHSILDDLVTQGRVIRGWLGIEAQEITPELAASFGLQAPRGVVISGVVPEGPAARAGLRPGDVLLEVDDRPILDARVAMSDIAAIQPGATLPLTVVRSGEKLSIELEVGERPTPQPRQPER